MPLSILLLHYNIDVSQGNLANPMIAFKGREVNDR